MLCITLKCGDYFVVGDNTVIQLDQLSNERVHLTIQAPREVTILRGEVLERNGGKRPDCVYEKRASPKVRQEPEILPIQEQSELFPANQTSVSSG